MKYGNFEVQYRKNLQDIYIPCTLPSNLECLSCLKEKKDSCTLLVRDKYKNQKYILKIAKNSRALALKRENCLLRELRKKGIRAFPSPQCLVEEGDSTYFLREFIEGETLISIVKRRGCMPERVLVRTALSLCRVLEILQAQNPCIIHRDIKPENIIYTKDRSFVLIDFETARKYSPGKSHDTMVMGSRLTAAPEQYGFSQTDCRTDIYGLGMTFLFLACGSYERSELKNSGISKPLRRIIGKAVAFEPGKRYRNARRLRQDLEKLRR